MKQYNIYGVLQYVHMYVFLDTVAMYGNVCKI